MYFGSYEHSLDDKGRLLIPRQLKGGLEQGSKLYILKGYEGCLSIYNEDEFVKLSKDCSSLSFNKKNSRDYLRLMLSSVTELIVDKVGRIQLPTSLINKYQIGKQVIIIGVGDHFEIWDFNHFNEYQAEANERFEQIAESLERNNE